MSEAKQKTKVSIRGRPVPVESQLTLLTLMANLLPSLLLIAALVSFDISLFAVGIIAVLLLFLTLYSVSTVWRRSQYQFRSLHSLLDAIVSGDYSFRGSHTAGSGAFGELISSINALAKTLQRQRLQSEESQLLVQKVVDQIDVAIIAWDQNQTIQLINPAARELLGLTETQTNEQTLPDLLVFANSMAVGQTQVKDLQFPESRGRYRLHLERFIADGNTHNLLFLTNVSSILRLEERKAWRNLVRVLSHEINNSLTPLKSFSNSLKTQIEKRETDEILKQELLDGVAVIGNRANSLAEFVQSYQKIARMPEPDKKPTDFQTLVNSLVKLFHDNPINLQGDSLVLPIDASQIEQVMINLIKNAVEASSAAQPVEVSWRQEGSRLIVQIVDNGEGIQNLDNLFTPYYTTKPSGSGVGLVFCQQVIEAHGGFLSITNRHNRSGCEVSMSLPVTEKHG